jgi:hypothetical protein
MQKVLIGVLAATTLVLGILCAVQAKQVRASKEQARAAEEARAAETEIYQTQGARVKELERANTRFEKQVQKFATVTSALRSNEVRQTSNVTAWAQQMRASSASGGTNAESGEGGIFGKDMGDMLGKMMKDPAMREMMREQQKVAINMMYAGLFKEMKLSAEEKDKFKAILTDAQLKNIENAGGLFGDKKDGVLDDTQKIAAESKKQTEAELKTLLGNERFAQYEDYQKNIGERMQLDQFKTRLEGENLALQDQQTAQLLQIMKEEKAAVPPVIPQDNTEFPKKELLTNENLDKQMQWMEDYNRRVLERVGQVLTPEQLKQYRDFQEQQTAMQKLGLNMARQMFGSGKGGGPAVPAGVK